MKTKKLIAGILIFVAIIISFIFYNKVEAAMSGLGYVKITKDRETTVNYSIEDEKTGNVINNSYTATYKHQLYSLENNKTKNIWKLVTCTKNGTTTSTATDLYCLRAGLGFTTETGGMAYNPNPVLYDKEYTMIEYFEDVKKALNNSQVTIFNNKDNFNAVMWILDNMLLEEATDEQVEAYLKKYAGYVVNDAENEFNLTPLKENVLTRADIEAIQQLALWYFTNSDEAVYNEETLSPLYANITGSIADTDGKYIPIETIFNAIGDRPEDGGQFGTMRQQAAETLYTNLLKNAKAAIAAAKANSTGFYSPKRWITVYLAGNGNAAEEQPIVQVREKTGEADIVLRKFISAVNGTELKQIGKSREPEVDTTLFNTIVDRKLQTTAEYNHTKIPYPVKIGDTVTYTIRLYNEGEVAACVKGITDYIPAWLAYNAYGEDDWDSSKGGAFWELSQNGYVAKTTENCKIVGAGGELNFADIQDKTLGKVLIPKAKYNENAENPKDRYTISYVDIQISCFVMTKAPYETPITNIAEVTKMTDKDGLNLLDRDSKVDNVTVPETNNLPTYKDEESNLDYVPGQQDDDDFDKVYIEAPVIDLSLRKFISAIGNEELKKTNLVTGKEEYIREPKVVSSVLKANEETAIYNHTKEPVKAEIGDIVTYKIRVYNEGDVPGKVTEITDYVDKALKYVPFGDDAEGKWWKETVGTNYNKIVSTDNIVIVDVGGNTNKEYIGKSLKEAILPAYDGEHDILSYLEVEVHCQIQRVTSKINLTNIAEITGETDQYDREIPEDIEERDSIPNNVEIPPEGDYTDLPTYKDDEIDLSYVPGQEDDDDFEKVFVEPKFDLSLRKFITGVQNTPINDRYPEVSYTNGKFVYKHTKKPVEVVNNDIVTYTIRIYNEGEADGYANEITDDMPKGLEFLPDNQINKTYRWKMLDEKQKETKDVSKAKYVVSDYLSEKQEEETGRDNLIKAFNGEEEITKTNPDYRDIKIAFKVTYEAKTKVESERIIVNVAQISADSDDDIDSDPTRDEEYKKDGENEDDIDYDNVRVKYFDLSLLKWVAQTKVTLNGKTEIKDTGHTAETSKNEAPVKIEIPSKDINKIVIKYVYTIQITNEGEIEGYAEEIRDYIPEGLRFEEADNKEWNWKMNENGTVTTDYLSKTLLKPGDTATVPIVLTWINNPENLGEKVNLAEISKDKNDSDSPDVDSTPDNKAPDEDDIDDAPVILAVKTGGPQTYIGLIAIILITFGTGVGLIKKYVLE